MRSFLKSWMVGLVIGLGLLSGAMAGVGLGPLKEQTSRIADRPTKALPAAPAAKAAPTAASHTEPAQVPALAAQKLDLNLPGKLPGGSFLVGSDATDLFPSPTLFGGEKWQTEGCTRIEDGELDRSHVLPGDGHGHPFASKDCIYLGGFGIPAPVRPAVEYDDGGVWVRSIAISNGESTVVMQILDAVGWFAAYSDRICDGCGINDMRAKIAADTGLSASNISIGATHTHAGPDGYGGWGGLPTWYWDQIRDSVIASAKQALTNMEAATITVGEAVLRDFNNERRDHYYSTADYQATWLQARAAGNGAVLATLTNYAGHPTFVGGPVLHADWPGAAARRLEGLYGGVGLLFEGGLGNVSIRGRGGETEDEEAENTGVAFAEAIAGDIGIGGTVLTTNDVAASLAEIQHPVTNPVLAVGGLVSLFARDFLPGGGGALPGAYHWAKPGAPNPTAPEDDDLGYLRGCDTASAVGVTTFAGGYRIGNALILFAPGEIFSNITEVAKSKTSGSSMTFVFAQTNDSLGYIIQSFEFDVLSNAATEYGTQTAEYEEFFAIDRCFGDHVMQTLLDEARKLGF
jgi:hypothetical protein